MNDASLSSPPDSTATAGSSPNPVSSIRTAASVPTPGWQTTEFWMTTLGQAGLVLAAASGALPAKYALLAGTLSQVAYSVSRGLAKSNRVPAA